MSGEGMDKRGNLSNLARRQLEREGYCCVECGQGGGFFDIAARRERMVLVKALEDINSLLPKQASGMRNVAAMFGGMCFLVGECAGGVPLKGGVVYNRHSVDAGTASTFGSVIGDGEVFVRKNRREYAKIDGNRLRGARVGAEMTLRGLAKASGISKDALYRYETGAGMASKEHAAALEEFFGTRLMVKVGVEESEVAAFDYHGFVAAKVPNPFSIVGRNAGGRERVVFGEEADRRTLVKRAQDYSGFSQVSGAECCFVVRKAKEEELMGIPVILSSEIEEARGAGEIISMIRERKR